MAILYQSRRQALSANGAILVGATLTVKNAGTSTLSSIYRDNGLTTPMTNPTSGADVSDSAGWFPQIFLAEGALFDITLKDALGNTIRTELNVASLGSGTATFTRDFGNSRLRIAGSGGVVRVEAGDPTGDDVGGQLTLGGYLGTPADVVTLDGTSVNATGTFTENGKSLEGVVGATGSFSAAASAIIPLTQIPTGTRVWDVVVYDLVTSASPVDIRMSLSFDNGATYSASAEHRSRAFTLNSTPGLTYTYATTTGYCTVAPGWGGSGGSIRLHLTTPVTTGVTYYQGDAHDPGVSIGSPTITGGGLYTNLGPATHIKFLPASGTFTGKWRLVPLRGY